MQGYKKIYISKEDIVPTAKRMRQNNILLAMIHAFIDKEGKANVSYDYEVGADIESYTVVGENILPSITSVYDLGAEWPEREIMELMDIKFEGVDASKRLFMPDTMLSGQGQILVTPMEQLKEMAQKGKEE